MADNTQLPIPSTSGDVIAADEIGGIKFQRVKLIVGADGVNDGDVSNANPLPTDINSYFKAYDSAHSAGDRGLAALGNKDGVLDTFQMDASGNLLTALPSGAATETTLDAINDKLPTAIVDMPTQDTPALPVRTTPQKYTDISFSQVGSGLLASELTQIRAGAGMTISQSAGNLVVATGTTVNSETVFRSVSTFNGAQTLKAVTTLSQRIVNNNFFVELVDVIGDELAYNIVNTTTVDVTLTGHGYTAQNVGQRMDLCALSSVGVPMEGVIASIPDANTIRFTVAGYPASGSGTLSLTGWNKIELLYTGTTATNLSFNTRRRGWQNTAATATINTTASGHMAAANMEGGVCSLADKTLVAGIGLTNRSSWDTNIPLPETDLYIQIRARNGTTAPASTTTWTIRMVRVEDYSASQVSLVSTRMQSLNNSLPVNVIGTVPVSGTVGLSGNNAVTLTPQTGSGAANLHHHAISAASTNATSVKGTAGTVIDIILSNNGASAAYFKLYSKATAPTVGTDTPLTTVLIPPGGTVPVLFPMGKRLGVGFGYAITGGMPVSDTTAVAANQVSVGISYV